MCPMGSFLSWNYSSLYSDNRVATNKSCACRSKPQTQVYNYLLKNRIVFQFLLPCIMHCCHFHLRFFCLNNTGYAPQFHSKQQLPSRILLHTFAKIMHLFHVQICHSTKMIKTCLVSGFKALKTCQILCSKFPQSDISLFFN